MTNLPRPNHRTRNPRVAFRLTWLRPAEHDKPARTWTSPPLAYFDVLDALDTRHERRPDWLAHVEAIA